MRRRTSGRQRGLTLLEFTLFTIIMAVLVALALERIARTRVQMERAAVEHNIARLREALALQFAELVVEERLRELPDHAGADALQRLGIAQEYRRVQELPPAAERQPGQWYFDVSVANVVYVPRYPEALAWPDGAPRLLRWDVRADWNDIDDDGEFDPLREAVRGLDLVRLDEAQWQ